MDQGQNTDLSIIVVSFNTRELLRDCLTAVLDKVGELKVEVFVVDNASHDGSSEMITEAFPQVHHIQNLTNRGFAAANNQALRVSSGRYVLLLNSDAIVEGSVLADTVRYLDEHPEVGVLGCTIRNPDGTVQMTTVRKPSIGTLILQCTGLHRMPWPAFCGRVYLSRWPRDCERDVDVIVGCFMCVRRSAIEQVGQLDESYFFYGEDCDWCRRFQKRGWAVRFVPLGNVVHFRNRSGMQLGWKRLALLNKAVVHYNFSHGGMFAGIAAWCVVLASNLGRFAFWLVGACLHVAGAREKLSAYGRALGLMTGLDNSEWTIPPEGRDHAEP